MAAQNALAQSKRDIRGFYPGMTSAEALNKLQKMNCRLLFENYTEIYLSHKCTFEGGRLPDDKLWVYLAKNLPSTPVWGIKFEFYSILKPEEVEKAVSEQFAVKVRVIESEQFTKHGTDLGGGLLLRLGLGNRYYLMLWSVELEAAEQKAAAERRLLENPAPKF